MEIRQYENIVGVVTATEIPEGRMVVLEEHSQSHNFGSREDLPAADLPADAAEAGRARFCLTFAVDNAEPPIFQPYPSFSFALRGGFDQASNVPFSATVHMTQPSMKEGLTIPSGALALAFGPGVYTVPSGAFVYSASLVKGAALAVANVADDTTDAGKLKYSATASFAEVVQYESVENKLTFRILY